MDKHKLSILVFSCDAYSDLWEGFFNSMEYYWKDIPYECYLVNNKKQFDKKGVTVLNGGDGDWSARVRVTLENLKTPYVMTFLDDYFICDKIDNEKIRDVLSYVESEKIDYYQLDITDKEDYYKWVNYKKNYLYDIPKTRDYWVDTSIAIWKKDFFLELLGNEDYSAWKFELDRNDDAKHPERYKSKICVFDSRLLVSMCPMVIQGKYYPKSIKFMQKKGFNIHIGNRKVMSKKEVFMHELKRYFSKIYFGRNFLKSIGRKLGFTFMSDLHNSKIN